MDRWRAIHTEHLEKMLQPFISDRSIVEVELLNLDPQLSGDGRRRGAAAQLWGAAATCEAGAPWVQCQGTVSGVNGCGLVTPDRVVALERLCQIHCAFLRDVVVVQVELPHSLLHLSVLLDLLAVVVMSLWTVLDGRAQCARETATAAQAGR